MCVWVGRPFNGLLPFFKNKSSYIIDMRTLGIIAALFVAVLFTSCGNKGNVKVEGGQASGLEGEWNVLAINGKALESDSVGFVPYIGIDLQSSRVYCFAGCNRMSATVKVEDTGALQFGQPMSTMMYCPNIDLEKSLMNAMSEVATFKFIGEGAALLDKEGKQIVTLQKKASFASLSDLNGSWNIVAVNGKSVSKKLEKKPTLTFDIAAGKVFGNTSCNNINGLVVSLEGSRNSLKFENVATTMMACPDMSTETAVLSALEGVESFGKLKNGNIGLFSGEGNLLIELKK